MTEYEAYCAARAFGLDQPYEVRLPKIDPDALSWLDFVRGSDSGAQAQDGAEDWFEQARRTR